MDLITKFKRVLTEPTSFFAAVKGEQGFGNPFLFFLVVMGIYYAADLLATTISQVMIATLTSSVPETLIVIVAGIFGAILGFAIGLGMVFVGAGILHLFLMLVGGKGDYLQTFKLITYSSAPMALLAIFTLLIIIPFLGPIIFGLIALAATIFQLILEVKGAMVLHEISMGKAAVAVIVIPLVIALFIALIVVVFGIFFITSMGMSGL
ncbi:MAG: YIP1 family protein [Nanobdellota archaeon]